MSINIQDLQQGITSKLESLPAVLNNFVFSSPADVSSFDTLQSSAFQQRDAFTDKYTTAIADNYTRRRANYLGRRFGSTPQTAQMIDTLMKKAPGAGLSYLGLHGLDTASKMITDNASAVSATFGIDHGSVLDPAQVAQRSRFASVVGAAAFKNNFDDDGGVKVDQTHGLSLPQVARIQNSLTSNKSHYEAWADTERKKTGSDKLSEGEIERFSKGLGATTKTLESFSKYMEGTQGKINKFVGSISKMAGSVEDAIHFMDMATGNRTFEAGEEADALREKALSLSNNLRVAAADAGMKPQELYRLAVGRGGFGDVFDSNRNIGELQKEYGSKTAFLPVGVMAAATLAEWEKNNKGASPEEKQRAYAGIQQRVANFAKGDSENHITLLAHAEANGLISKEETTALAKEGNIGAMRKRLSDIYGDEGTIDDLISNSAFMYRTQKNHAEEVKNLAIHTLSSGMLKEDQRYSAQNKLEEDNKLFAALGKKFGVKEGDLSNLQRESEYSASAFEAAGIDKKTAESLAEQAKKENWDQERIHTAILENKGSYNSYRKHTIDSYQKAVQAQVVDKAQGADKKKLQSIFNRTLGGTSQFLYGKEITDAELEEGAKNVRMQEARQQVESLALNFNKAQTVSDSKEKKKMQDDALVQFRVHQAKALNGDKDSLLSYGGGTTAQTAITNILKDAGIKDEDSSIFDEAVNAYNDAGKNGYGESYEAAMVHVRGVLEKKGVKKDVLDKYMLTGEELAAKRKVQKEGDKASKRDKDLAQAASSRIRGKNTEVAEEEILTSQFQAATDAIGASLTKQGKSLDLDSAEKAGLLADIQNQKAKDQKAGKVKDNGSYIKDAIASKLKGLEGMSDSDVDYILDSSDEAMRKAEARTLKNNLQVDEYAAGLKAKEDLKDSGKRDAARREALDKKAMWRYTGDTAEKVVMADMAINISDKIYQRNERGDVLIGTLDLADAKAQNQQFAALDKEAFDRTKRKLNTTAKTEGFRALVSDGDLNLKKAIAGDDQVRKKLSSIDGNASNFTNEELISSINSFVTENTGKGLSAEEIEKKFKDTFGKDAFGKLISAQGSDKKNLYDIKDEKRDPNSLLSVLTTYSSGLEVGTGDMKKFNSKVEDTYAATSLYLNPSLSSQTSEYAALQDINETLERVISAINALKN